MADKTFIKKPILYCDFLQYFSAIQNTTANSGGWQYTPPHNIDYLGLQTQSPRKRFTFQSGAGENYYNPFFSLSNIRVSKKFLKQANYLAIFGHTLASTGTGIEVSFHYENTQVGNCITSPLANGGTGTSVEGDDYNSTGFTYDGFSLLTILPFFTDPTGYVDEIRFYFHKNDNPVWGYNLDVAGISLGRSFVFPTPVDLSSKVTFSNDNVDNIKSPSGRELYKVTTDGRENHGQFIPFQYYKNEYEGFHSSGTYAMEVGKRTSRANFQFQVSYLDDDKIIPTFDGAFDQKKADDDFGANYFEDHLGGDGTIGDVDNIGALMNVTYNGKLPMMLNANSLSLTPDGEFKNDKFYIVKNKKKEISYTPISPNLYNIKFDLIETW